MICSKEKTKILFINPCLRPGGHTKLLSVGLASVMTYFDERGYEFELLDIDINDYDDEYVEKFIKNKFVFPYTIIFLINLSLYSKIFFFLESCMSPNLE